MLKIAIDISQIVRGSSMDYYARCLYSFIVKILKTKTEFQNLKVDLIADSGLKATNYQLIHYPFFDPYKATLPPKPLVPYIVTVPDLIPRQFKDHFPVGIKGEITWLLQKHRLKHSSGLITISHFSKHVIKDIIRYPEDKIFVTWLAPDNYLRPVKNRHKLTDIRKKYQLPSRFVMFCGDIYWSKNIPNLVRTCLSLKYPLVIVGQSAVSPAINHPWNQDLIWLQQQKSPWLRLIGPVSKIDKKYLYNLATIYCQPSLAEGFGLPVVEAMKCGCPVVYSQESSLPEIMYFSGEYFDPYHPDSLRLALEKIWTNSSCRKQLIASGLKRVQVFNWQYTALQTLAVYQLALIDHQK